MKASQLSESDKRAVDMLLDELAQTSLDQPGFTTAANSVASPKSLQAARTVLGRLEYMDAGEPSPDLVMRCMAKIERAVRNGEIASPVAHTQQPTSMLGARVDA